MNGDSEDEFMGAIKVKDGLFIGDEFSAQVRNLDTLISIQVL